jgi:hypothetical protein
MEGKLLATICRRTLVLRVSDGLLGALGGPCQYRLVEEVSVDRSSRSCPHPRREELRRHGRAQERASTTPSATSARFYRKALDHYIEASIADRMRRCEKLAPREAISFLAEIVKRSLEDRQPRFAAAMMVLGSMVQTNGFGLTL